MNKAILQETDGSTYKETMETNEPFLETCQICIPMVGFWGIISATRSSRYTPHNTFTIGCVAEIGRASQRLKNPKSNNLPETGRLKQWEE